jgi:hypothetical protein
MEEWISKDMTRKAEKLYEDFHKYPATRIDEMHRSFFIPETAACVGPALYVLYRSSKLDPFTYAEPEGGSIDYIHEHKKGVKVYLPDSDWGPDRKVPKRIHESNKLTFLGECLGFGYIDDDGDEVEATCRGKVELCSTPSGKALLVVENRKEVLALIWGGTLGVKPQGIVG